MGGNLFKLGRLPRAQYLEIEADVCAHLDALVGRDHYRIPRYYGDKPDFGDLDIIISQAACQPSWEVVRDRILDAMNVTQSQSTGAVFSTVYRNFQVDYFVRSEAYFLTTYHFLSFNDLGNLLGKIFRRFNLKYGERGLYYVFRRENDEHYKQDLEVSRDFPRTLAFLNLDYATWEAGFESLDALFEWVIACPWFSVAPYVDAQSRTTRKRTKQRTTVKRFMAYLEQRNVTKRHEFGPRESYLERITSFFPKARLEEQIAVERAREARVLEVRKRFSGKLVMALIPELQGKALGQFIQSFKASFDGDFEETLLQLSVDDVKARILEYWKASS